MLDFERFTKLDGKNIYVGKDINPNTSIFRYTDLFNLLMLSRNQFYVGAKKNSLDKLESGKEFFILSSDFAIARESRHESQAKKADSFGRKLKIPKTGLPPIGHSSRKKTFLCGRLMHPVLSVSE